MFFLLGSVVAHAVAVVVHFCSKNIAHVGKQKNVQLYNILHPSSCLFQRSHEILGICEQLFVTWSSKKNISMKLILFDARPLSLDQLNNGFGFICNGFPVCLQTISVGIRRKFLYNGNNRPCYALGPRCPAKTYIQLFSLNPWKISYHSRR